MDTQAINKGGFSQVFRPHPSQFGEGQVKYIIKRPRSMTEQQKAQRTTEQQQKRKRQTIAKYTVQKKMLDIIRMKNPSVANLFNQVYQIRQTQSRMKDLGNMNLRDAVVNGSVYRQIIKPNMDQIFDQLIKGTIAILSVGIVNRDIKLENIMVVHDEKTNKYNIVFIDFADSLTRYYIEHKMIKVDNPDTFNIFGTKFYMSPELLRRRQYKDYSYDRYTAWGEYVANDLWTLGMVMYYLIYRMSPYEMYKKVYHPKRLITPLQFYERALLHKNSPMYENIFPIRENIKSKHLTTIKQLLSLDPNMRIQWYQDQLNAAANKKRKLSSSAQQGQSLSKKKKKSYTPSIQQQTQQSSSDMQIQTQQQQSSSKKNNNYAVLHAPGIQMLLDAATQIQKQKLSNQNKSSSSRTSVKK